MTPRHGRRARVPFGLLLIALGIAVGVLAYLVGRADDEAGAQGAGTTSTAREPDAGPSDGATGPTSAASPSAEPKGKLLIHGTGDVSLDPSYIPALGLERLRLGVERARRALPARRPHGDQPRVPVHRHRRADRQAVRVPLRPGRARRGAGRRGGRREPREQPRVRPGAGGPARLDPEPPPGRHRADRRRRVAGGGRRARVRRGQGVDDRARRRGRGHRPGLAGGRRRRDRDVRRARLLARARRDPGGRGERRPGDRHRSTGASSSTPNHGRTRSRRGTG